MRKPNIHGARTAAERKKDSVQARGVGRVELPRDTLADVDTLVQRHGDRSRAAAVARAVRVALGNH